MQIAELSTTNQAGKHGPLKGKCCVKPGSYIKGTYFLGGAGLNGLYIPKLIEAFHKTDIKSAIHLDREKWSAGQNIDATVGVFFGREYDPRFPMLLRAYPNAHKQFNLIGYSYGSLIAAQLAVKYARHGSIVNHLVLIGSPISQYFLNIVKNMKTIKKVIIINLDKHGDPIFAGMDTFYLMTSARTLQKQLDKKEGHFYYAKEGSLGNKRRKELAEELYKLGLR